MKGKPKRNQYVKQSTNNMTQEQLLLKSAAVEITSLRRQNELMSARLDMFDKCMILLHTTPAYPSQGMSVDIVWEIEKHLKETYKGE